MSAGAQLGRVVVVGAGPTGLAAAVLLATYGVPVLVLDRHADAWPEPRAVHLDDEVLRVLDRVGVAEQFAAVSRPTLGLRLVDRDLRVLAQFARTAGTGVHGYPQANLFDQPALDALLRARAREVPLVQLRSGVEVVGLEPRDGWARPVDVVVEDVGAGTRERLEAQYVLGCDGAGSTVRRAMGSAMRELARPQRWLVVDVDTDADLGHWDGVHQVCDRTRAATFMRVGERRYRWELRLLAGESADDYRSVERLLPVIGPWTGARPAADLHLVRVAEYTFRAQVADRWRRGSVLLLGDAAHLTPPFIGQGLGAGLRDAHNLAWKLVGVLSGELPADALDSYQAEREPHVRSLVHLAVLVGTAMTGGGAAGEALRRLVLPRARFVPGLRRRVVDSATPRLRRSALLPAGRLRPGLVGTLAPNAVLADGRRLDRVSRGFLLVTRAAPTAAQERELDRKRVAVVVVGGDEPLAVWLRRAGVDAAVVRPDLAVQAASRDVDAMLAGIPVLPGAVVGRSPVPSAR